MSSASIRPQATAFARVALGLSRALDANAQNEAGRARVVPVFSFSSPKLCQSDDCCYEMQGKGEGK